MKSNISVRPLFTSALALIVAMYAAQSGAAPKSDSTKRWNVKELSQALATPSRPQADRDRDADRKPAQLMAFFGVGKGMTTMDVIGLDGYLTEVLSIAVGPNGKVYLQNGPAALQLRNGAVLKGIEARLANNRLPNVVRVDDNLPNPAVPANSVDFAVTAMNLHDLVIRGGAPAATAFMKGIYSALKPGGVLGVVDHVGIESADNTKLHRMPKQQAIDIAKEAGFVVEAESNLLANSTDDHMKYVLDPAIRGKTDQFILRLRKPK
jgi:predicted methyltransferase